MRARGPIAFVARRTAGARRAAGADDGIGMILVAELDEVEQLDGPRLALGPLGVGAEHGDADVRQRVEVGEQVVQLEHEPDLVATELVDALTVDTRAELAAVPAANAPIVDKLNFIFMMLRNKITQTSTTKLLKADDGTTTVGTSTVSDDGTTFTQGEMA